MTRSTRLDRAALAATLAQQYHVISRRQVMALGMTASALRQRLRAEGPWQRMLPGVFLTVTGTPTVQQRNVAALLYAGSGSLITGTAAVRLRGLPAPTGSMIDVLVPAARQRKSTGFVRIHPTARMPEEVFTMGPVRLAPLNRAVADAARGLTSLADVRALVAAVVQQGKCQPDQLAAELRAGPVQGSALFRVAVGDICDGIRSSPEADLKDLIRRAKITAPGRARAGGPPAPFGTVAETTRPRFHRTGTGVGGREREAQAPRRRARASARMASPSESLRRSFT